ncbi:PadR family transcriptional regulator [Arsenicitalea aurantiaca]|uniref:PadR family transcriptional regulator n=1 Tax=Arsenicitalea aurantiaca TaxID=1783274 RepID=A0A433X3H9_9HYPH|nr:PadR family transcriptional regulator [Arsenicitalea aurantiaca]RUT28623.1 PadR family transcriptional regulator [Arsenicitalea aurantiaca]
MNVRTVCLSILHEGDATGYEIRRSTVEGDCSYFVEASFGSIYPALAKLEADGLVTSRIEPQDGKPSRKVYSITPAGRAAFQEALLEPLGADVFRSTFLLFSRFAHLVPASLVQARIDERLEQMAEEIAQLEDILARRGSNASDAWVIRYGLTCVQAAYAHLQSHKHELVALALGDDQPRQAAE